MRKQKIELRIVGLAILVALAVSIPVIVIARMSGMPESGETALSTVVFTPVFLAACAARRGKPSRSESL